MEKGEHHMCKSRQTKQLRTQAHNMIYFRGNSEMIIQSDTTDQDHSTDINKLQVKWTSQL